MNLDFSKICRLCLRFCDEYVDLCQTNGVKNLTKEITEKIMFCYCVQIDVSESLPTKVCYQCIQVLTFFNVTKKNIMASEQMLRNILFIKKKLETKELSNIQGVDSATNATDSVQTNSITTEHKNSSQTNLKIRNGHVMFQDSNCVKSEDSSEIYKNKLLYHKQVNAMEEDKKILNVTQTKKVKLKKNKKSVFSSKFNQNQKKDLNRLKKSSNKKLKLKMLRLRELKKLKYKTANASHVPTEGDRCQINETLQPEKIVKVIGTVIDLKNILSPDIKRQRKTLR